MAPMHKHPASPALAESGSLKKLDEGSCLVLTEKPIERQGFMHPQGKCRVTITVSENEKFR
jgi:hypothetical protein